MEAFFEEFTVFTHSTILGYDKSGISSVSKDSFRQNVVAEVRLVNMCHPQSPYKEAFLEKPEEMLDIINLNR